MVLHASEGNPLPGGVKLPFREKGVVSLTFTGR
jgi:hypothetical protein